MTLPQVIKDILRSTSKAMTPQEIRDVIKSNYPRYYGTPSHISNVKKGYYQNLDHALLAQIYSLLRVNNSFFCDKSQKPMKIMLNIHKVREKQESNISPEVVNIGNDDDLVENINYYYGLSLEVLKDFGGPSIYFHVQSIKEQEIAFLSDRHIEMIYATLASWGMHKMGDPKYTKAKMVDFSTFKYSIIKNHGQLQEYYPFTMDSFNQEEYKKHIENLREIYYTLEVSTAKATIVAHSKTLAHILPNLIPPIDRQYTIRFFTQNKKNFFTKSGKYRAVNLPKGIDAQFAHFVQYCCKIKMICDRCDHELFMIDKETFNTSFPKIMDNIIMAFVKDVPKPVKSAKKK